MNGRFPQKTAVAGPFEERAKSTLLCPSRVTERTGGKREKAA
jgi:hypothetical protein